MPTRLLAVLVPLALVAGLTLAPRVRAEGPPRVEHRVLSWTPEDTEAVLRAVTGQSLVSVEQMAHDVARADVEAESDPRVQAAIDARLATKLAAAGAEGFEGYAVLSGAVNVGGVLIPAPRVLLQRRAP